jgi:hypothetical protein
MKELEQQLPTNAPLISDFILNPISKYHVFGVFPWKMFLHLSLVVLASFQLNNLNRLLHSYTKE